MTISRKLTIGIISVIFVIGLLSAYLYYNFQMEEETERLGSLGNAVGPLVEQGLENYMMTKDYNFIDKTLNNLKSIKPISRILLINREGVIKAGNDKNVVGIRLSPNDPRCQRCHEKGKRGLLLKDEETFRWVQPITNKPECYKCHRQSVKYNGVLIIDFSLSESEKHVKRDIIKGFLIFIPSIIIIGFAMLVLSKKLIIKRINSIIDRVKILKEGDYNVRIPLEGNDEITNLADDFNEMAEAINIRDREKDGLLKNVSRSQREWKETFDSITDLVSIHDRDFNIIRANRAFLEHFGLTNKEVINRKCYELFHGTDSPLINCPHKITLHENRPETVEVLDPKTDKIFRVSTFRLNY